MPHAHLHTHCFSGLDTGLGQIGQRTEIKYTVCTAESTNDSILCSKCMIQRNNFMILYTLYFDLCFFSLSVFDHILTHTFRHRQAERQTTSDKKLDYTHTHYEIPQHTHTLEHGCCTWSLQILIYILYILSRGRTMWDRTSKKT